MAVLALTGAADVGGGAARVGLAWSAPSTQPRSLRLVRRRRGVPTGPDDGRVVLDLADLFPSGAAASPWATIDRWRYTLDNARAEGGVLQAELAAYYAAPGDAQPHQVAVHLAPAPGGAPQSWSFANVSRVTRTTATPAAPAPFASVTTISIFTQPSGNPEALAATLVVSTAPREAGALTKVLDYTQASGDAPLAPRSTSTPAPNQLAWTPAGAAAQTLPFGRQALTTTSSALHAVAPLTLAFTTAAADPAVGRGALPLAVADASNTAPIVITTATPHGLTSGVAISVAGTAGNTAANGVWTIGVLNNQQFSLTGSTGNGTYAAGGIIYPPIVREAELSETANGVTGQIDRTLTVVDREPPTPQALPGLPAGAVAYYAAFQDIGAGLAAGDTGAVSVLVTGGYGFGETLFALLPGVHRLYDDPAAGLQGSWQLRRYLGLAGAGLDQARSLRLGEALPSLRDAFAVRADFLPQLAQQIGWQTDRTLPTERQRTDILFAPEVYGSIGTGPNLRALAERSTGWSCRVKEFVDNVFLTNGVEVSQLWQIADCATSDPATAFSAPDLTAQVYPPPGETLASQAHPDTIDARPAAALGSDGTVWLFWHSNRLGSEWQAASAYQAAPAASILAPVGLGGLVYECTKAGVSGAASPAFPTTAGASVTDGAAVWTCRGLGVRRRRIWLQRLGVDPTPVNVVGDLPDAPGVFDETPAALALAGAIWLAWSSNRSGHPEIWLRAWTGGAPGPAATLVRQLADNRFPALATSGGAGAPLWALWESTQAGQTRIWGASSTDAGATWSAPAPVSPGPRDRTPAAVFDAAAQLHVYWAADSGDASHLRRGVLVAGAWTVSEITGATPHVHDAAPSAALWKNAIRLVWQSNRFGAAWAPNSAVGPASFLLAPGGNGQVYQCTTAGLTGAAAPAFPTALGATVADGSAVWTCRGRVAAAPLAQTRRLWSASGPTFAPATQLFQRAANDSQPATLVDQAGSLRLFMATQQSAARYRSRTFDTSVTPAAGRPQTANALARTSMGGLSDRLHYTYDTRRNAAARYARDTVGLFLTPGDGLTDAQHAATTARLRAFLSPFRPVTERLVYLVQPMGGGNFTPVEVDP